MGDLFLHLGFARRLRFADGLHPVVIETLVRQPAPVVAAATLPLLPGIEHKGASLFRRLLGRGKAESARWARQLGVEQPPRGDLVVALLKKRAQGPGQMTRLALALGALSHTVLESCVGDIASSLEGAERQAVERGQARLWLQLAVPSLRDLAREWSAATALDDTDRVRRALEQLDVALREIHGDAPGVDTLARWGRALAAETAPLEERAALPPEGALPEHEVRARYFEGDAAFLEKAQRAIQWFVFLANELGALSVGAEPSEEAIRAALCESSGELRPLPDDFDVDASRAAWQDQLRALRAEHLERGRNPKPAYYESHTESYARAGATPPLPPLPDDASGAVPTSTQEISAADIEDEIPTPATTQEISAADIEEEAEAARPPLPVPAKTQEISAADIEDEIQPPPAAPTVTQELSTTDIEEESEGEVPPQVPTSTQQISAADIEEELAAGEGEPTPPDETSPDAAASAPDAPAPAAPSSDVAPSSAAPASDVPPAEVVRSEASPSQDAETQETGSDESAPRAADNEGFAAPPHTPPLGTLPPDAPVPPTASSSSAQPASAPSAPSRTRTPPLGTPISHVNGHDGHDDERASVDEGQAAEDGSNRSA